ncbi:hypothetical protein RDWZM_006184 [Blomia tropicalis]|uniref:Odorant receptor n=1 Tax=Blomia tropicalis TaxID=40697 RepID=A0A9Q0M7D3_BLOTA|nr:hypothetical protein RDWZM_006184 [Blomia tropicalis]
MSSYIVKVLYNTRVGRCYYHMMKQTMEWHGTRRSRLYYYLDVAILFYIHVRLLAMTYLIKNNYEIDARFPYNFRRDDPFQSFIYQNKDIYGAEVPLMMLAMGIFNFICQDSLYRLNVSTLTWRWWYQLIVTNQDNYYQFHMHDFGLITMAKSIEMVNRMNIHPFWSILPQFIIEFIAGIYSKIMIQYNLEQIDRQKYLDKKLSILPHLSLKLRSKLIKTLLMWDIFALFSQILIGTIVFAGHIIEMNQKIWKLIKKCRKKGGMLCSISNRSHMIVSNQLSVHNRVTYLVISGSHELFAFVLYAFLLTNIPVNVYLIQRNIFEQQKLMDQMVLWTVVFIQLIVFIIVFGPLAWCAEVYHSPAKFIPILQPMLRGSSGWLWHKMKYEDLYHRLIDDGPKLAVCVGSVREITYMASIEVCTILASL